MRPVVYSASSVTSYQNCHLQWYFTYIALERGTETEPQRVGIQVHEYIERKLRALGDGVQPRDTSNRPEIKALLRIVDNDIVPTYRKPLLIEAAFQLEVNDIPFSGVLDALDEHRYEPPGEVDWDSEGRSLLSPFDEPFDIRVLRDTKTTGSRPARGKFKFAMTGYWLGAIDLGYEPVAAQLDWIVRTKHPYYWPEVMDPVTEDDVNQFARTLELVANGVERGDYQPTGLGTWACKACPHAAICGPYQRFKEVNDA